MRYAGLPAVLLLLASMLGCSSGGDDDGDAAGDDTSDTASWLDTDDGTVQTSFFTEIELDTHDQLNAYRQEQGKLPLIADPFLGELARQHSLDMLSGAVPFGHDGFDARGDDMFDDGAVSVGENVAYSQGSSDPVNDAIVGWLNSPGHHGNIVGDFTHGGVGVATDGSRYYFTHLFALKR